MRKWKNASVGIRGALVCISTLILFYICTMYVGLRSRELEDNPNHRFPSDGVMFARKDNVTKSKSSSGMSNSKLTPVQPDLAVTNGYNITLTIHMTAVPELINQMYCIALRSAALFWSPKLGKIGFIFDAESKRDHEFAAQLKAQEELLGFSFDMMFQPLPPSGLDYFASMKHIRSKSAGYNRQLWNSFFIDEYVTTSVVAWTDNDVLFTTPVTPENIFNGDKIRTFGEYFGPSGFDRTTLTALGKKMVAQFTCFPLFMWRNTVTNCRNHILKHMKVSRFEDAFVNFNGPFSCPINIIFTYAFYFEHDRYDWHIRLPGNLRTYNKNNLSPGSSLTPSDLTPTVCVAMHKPYYDPKRIVTTLKGYCTSMHYLGEKRPNNCKHFQNQTDFQVLESRTYSKRKIPEWCEGEQPRNTCVKVSDAHYKNVAQHVKAGLFDLDLKRISEVEKAAKKMNITCRKMDGL